MHIKDILNSNDPTFSFEFFPPKSAEAADKLYNVIRDLESYKPSFVSVTYGAGGSTRELTHDLVVKIKETTEIPPIPPPAGNATSVICIQCGKGFKHPLYLRV